VRKTRFRDFHPKTAERVMFSSKATRSTAESSVPYLGKFWFKAGKFFSLLGNSPFGEILSQFF